MAELVAQAAPPEGQAVPSPSSAGAGDPAADGELARLQALEQELGIDDVVTFLGSRDQDTLVNYYNAASMVVGPVALRVVRHGRAGSNGLRHAVIASKVGGLSLNVADGFNGYLVPKGDVDELAYKMELLLEHEQLRAQLGTQACQWAQRFSWQTIADETLAVYARRHGAGPSPTSPPTCPIERGGQMQLPQRGARMSLNAPSPLKAVIFDFGGVLVRTRSQHLRTAWEQRLGLAPGEASERSIFGGERGAAVQHGRITDEAHWQWLGDHLGLGAADLAALRTDFFAEDFLDTDLLAYADRLRSAGFHLGLLSNAGDNARWIFGEHFAVLPHFDSVTISAEEGVMKPAPPHLRDRAAPAPALRPTKPSSSTTFAANVEGARRVGMPRHPFPAPPAQTIDDLAALTGVAPSRPRRTEDAPAVLTPEAHLATPEVCLLSA